MEYGTSFTLIFLGYFEKYVHADHALLGAWSAVAIQISKTEENSKSKDKTHVDMGVKTKIRMVGLACVTIW